MLLSHAAGTHIYGDLPVMRALLKRYADASAKKQGKTLPDRWDITGINMERRSAGPLFSDVPDAYVLSGFVVPLTQL